MSGNSRSREMECVRTLVALLRATDYPGVKDPEWIDGHQKGNALPEARAHPFLIEHFSIDSTKYQRALSAQFSKIIEGLESKFADVEFALRVAMPEHIAQVGRNWEQQRGALTAWISERASSLTDGHCVVRVDGFDEDFHVWKNVGLNCRGVRFMRWTPSGANHLQEFLKEYIPKKVQKLVKHRVDGERCLLLVESDDIALMSAHAFLEALNLAFAIWPEDVDDLWFCHTMSDSQSELLNARTGNLYLFNKTRGALEVQSWITVP